MEHSLPTDRPLSPGCVAQDRKYFYSEFLEFSRHYPEMRISLYISRNDLSLLAREECFSIVCDLVDLCLSGRLTLTRTMPRLDPLDFLRGIRNRQSTPFLLQEVRVGSPADSGPDAA